MALPFVDVSSPILKAYFDGLAVRQREIENQQQNQVQQEQLKMQSEKQKLDEAREKRLEQQAKEQLRIQEQGQTLRDKTQMEQIKLMKLQREMAAIQTMANLRFKFKPENQQQIEQENWIESAGGPAENVQPQFTQPQEFMGMQFEPQQMEGYNQLVGNQEAQERRLEMQLRQREEAERQRAATESARIAQREADSKRDFEATMARVGAMNARGSANNPDTSSTVNDLMPRIMDGTINEETIGKMVGSKSREAVIREVASRGEFIQSKKWQEESRKLAGAKGYLQLIERFTQSDPFKSAEHFGKFWALSGLTRQQIGQYGAQFPALGRLSDADIRLLESGIPTKINVVLEKFGLPKTKAAAASFIRTVMDESKRAYALSVKTHFATVPNDPEIRYRLTEQYGLNLPGLGNYFKELK
jgi:hypothetical protein